MNNHDRLDTIVFIIAIALVVICLLALPTGCASLRKASEATTQAASDPTVQALVTATPTPIDDILLGLVGAVGWAGLYLTRRKWKTAFSVVVKSLEPHIPEDEAEREKIKEVQGEDVTKLVKEAKQNGGDST